jgi:hypothetical protein
MLMRTALVLLSAGIVTILVASPLDSQTTGAAPADAVAVQQFEAAVAEYVTMRRRLANEISGPVPNSTSVQLNNASDMLAAAIQRSRPNARVGDLFVAPVAPVFKRTLGDAVRTGELTKVLAAIDDEEPIVREPQLHLRFPGSAQMATMPPTLLAVLPRLPKELEYRIVGRYLVLRDIDAALIIDYVPDLIPR